MYYPIATSWAFPTELGKTLRYMCVYIGGTFIMHSEVYMCVYIRETVFPSSAGKAREVAIDV